LQPVGSAYLILSFMTTKTNAMRRLEQAGISFELRTYVYDEARFSAEDTAAQLGMAQETVFKTLLTRSDRNSYLFALVPAGCELDLRALAAAAGVKRVEMVSPRELVALTGYERGAVTVLAARHAYPVFADETLLLWPRVAVSAGAHGLQLALAPEDLVRISHAATADIAVSSKP